MESVSGMSPGLLAHVGIVCMSGREVGWRVLWEAWRDSLPEKERSAMKTLSEKFLEPVMNHMDEFTKPPVLAGVKREGHYRRVVPCTNEVMISTLISLFEVGVDCKS